MSRERQALAWAVLLAFFVVFLAVFSEILLPFVAGLGVAYFFDPLADRLERNGLSRFVATFTIVTIAGLVGAAVVFLIVPLLVNQVRELAHNLPEQIHALRAALEHAGERWLDSDFPEMQAAFKSELGEFAKSDASTLATFLQSVWSGGLAVVNFLSLLTGDTSGGVLHAARLGSHDSSN